MKSACKFLALVGIMAAFSACKKDEDGNPIYSERQNNLVGKNWVLTDRLDSSSVTGTTPISTYDVIEACEKDDLMLFQHGTIAGSGKVVFKEGATKCDPEAADEASGNWIFQSSQTKLSLTKPSGVPNIYDIQELTPSSMKLRFTLTISGVETARTFVYAVQ